MIRCEKDEVRIVGSTAVMLTELTCLIEAIYNECLLKHFSQNYANEILADIGRLAVMEQNEMKEYVGEKTVKKWKE